MSSDYDSAFCWLKTLFSVDLWDIIVSFGSIWTDKACFLGEVILSSILSLTFLGVGSHSLDSVSITFMSVAVISRRSSVLRTSVTKIGAYTWSTYLLKVWSLFIISSRRAVESSCFSFNSSFLKFIISLDISWIWFSSVTCLVYSNRLSFREQSYLEHSCRPITLDRYRLQYMSTLD